MRKNKTSNHKTEGKALSSKHRILLNCQFEHELKSGGELICKRKESQSCFDHKPEKLTGLKNY